MGRILLLAIAAYVYGGPSFDGRRPAALDRPLREFKRSVDAIEREGPHGNAPRPGLIFLDIEMPGMNGQDTLKWIRSQEQFRDIPVVMMTGVAEENQMEEAAANGANSYTIKPANAEQFLRTVLASTNYWLTIHQYPKHHLPPEQARR